MNPTNRHAAGASAMAVLLVLGLMLFAATLSGQVGHANKPANIKLKLNVNRASAQRLEVLPGIGPTIAGNIVAYRKAHGPFKTLEELDNVSRIGAITRRKFQEYLTLE